MKVCGNPWWHKSIGTIFPAVLAHFCYLCHILVIFTIFPIFHYDYDYNCYDELQSAIFDVIMQLFCGTTNHTDRRWELVSVLIFPGTTAPQPLSHLPGLLVSQRHTILKLVQLTSLHLTVSTCQSEKKNHRSLTKQSRNIKLMRKAWSGQDRPQARPLTPSSQTAKRQSRRIL